MPAHEIKGGPSDAAVAAYSNDPGGRPFPLLAAHQPALGLDRSVCLRDVVDALCGAVGGGRGIGPQAWRSAADFLEREFGAPDQ